MIQRRAALAAPFIIAAASAAAQPAWPNRSVRVVVMKASTSPANSSRI